MHEPRTEQPLQFPERHFTRSDVGRRQPQGGAGARGRGGGRRIRRGGNGSAAREGAERAIHRGVKESESF
ncbi:MAG TPA: hypothetical protein VKC57_07875 [Ktedonobacterales bacterium]|nr:hypothetical protein [Ktedonobacterales bacterium]